MGRVEELEPRRLLAAAGSLDPSFGGDGVATVSPPDGETLTAADVAVQADGKTVVVGSSIRIPTSGSTTPASGFVTARFNVDGTLDTTFADAGIARLQLRNLSQSSAKAVAIAPDGKIVVAGEAMISTEPDQKALAVVRYNADGSLDNTFAGTGRLTKELRSTPSLPAEVRDVALAPDGRIVVVGTEVGSFSLFNATVFFADYFVTFVEPDGRLGDTESLQLTEGAGAHAVKIDAGGRVVVAGTILFNNGTPHMFLLRLPLVLGGDEKGQSNYLLTLPGRTTSYVQDMMPQGGKIVVAGRTLGADGKFDVFVARFDETFTLDTTFAGGAGFRITDLGGDDVVGGIILSPEGTGFLVSGRSGEEATVAVKYTDDGAIDTTFGTGGVARLPGAANGIPRIAPGPGHRVAIAGGDDFFTARMLLAGANVFTVGTPDSLAQEGTSNTAKLLVSRTERLPYSTRVFLNVSGTASFSNDRSLPRDYAMPGLVVPNLGAPYVDIPAYAASVTLTLTTINDSRVEGTETAVFTVAPRATYEVGSPSVGRINIADDDGSDPRVGTTTPKRPRRRVAAGRELRTEVTWAVPSGGWRGLSSIQLRLRDLRRRDALVFLTFDEATNSFSLDATPAAARYEPIVLEPQGSTFRAAGAAAPEVAVTFAYRFTGAAARRRFALEVAAGNDAGQFSGFTPLGRVFVTRRIPRRQPQPGPTNH